MGVPRAKYQVFISSTYGDLKVPREAVTWAVLGEGHIPAGMESFPATDERGWRIIQSTIDLCDYYVLLVAGRYGSVDPTTGLSWTEREYNYALERKIPVLAFIRRDESTTAAQVERDPDLAPKLADLKARLRRTHLCKDWDDEKDLVAKITTALHRQIVDDEDRGSPRLGWFRGDQIPSIKTMEELARLSAENADLRIRLSQARVGEAILVLKFLGYETDTVEETWRVHKSETGVVIPIVCSIRNTGTGPARAVRASIMCSGGEFRNVFVADSEQTSFTPREPRDPRDPKYRVCVDTVVEFRGRRFEVVQRAASLGPGASEHLMGFNVWTAFDQTLTLDYELSSEDGPVQKGRLQFTVHANVITP